jgi:hypothetical protein
MMKFVAACLMAAAALPAWAHHSFAAEVDASKPLKLEDTVTKMEWINPHSWIHIDVKNPDGTVTNWTIEGGSPNALLRRGFTKHSLEPRSQIIVEGYQAKDGANRANGGDLTFADSRNLFIGSNPDEKTSTSESPVGFPLRVWRARPHELSLYTMCVRSNRISGSVRATSTQV